MNEDLINSFLQEVELQTDKISPNSLFSAAPAEPPKALEPDRPAQEEQQPAQTTDSLPPAPQAQTEQNSTPAPDSAESAHEEPEAAADAQPSFDFFDTAVEQAKQDSEKRLLEILTARAPLFQYSKMLREITDPEATFEDLRLQAVGDYPELDAKDREYKWSVTYGSVIKSITDTGTKVYDVKAQIEKSTAFLDGLKNAKKEADKKPKCYVKVNAVFQKKGKVNVLQMYPTLEDAIASEKEVTYVPFSDGIYQVRNNDIGIFAAPAKEPPERQPEDNRFFQFRLPEIPATILLQVISFFQYVCTKNRTEVLANILYDRIGQKYICDVPKQKVSGYEVTANAEYDDVRHLHVMDIHSHNTMPAFFSGTDDADELASRLYMVIGKLDEAVPQMKLRASCGGKFIPLEPKKIFDIQPDSYPFPKAWLEKLEFPKQPRIMVRLKGVWNRYAGV